MLRAYESYLRNEKRMRERSIRDYMLVAQEISQNFDLVGPLTYRQVNDSLKALKEKLNWSQGTIYKYSICTRHLFKWLQREEYRPDNPYPFSEWRKPRPATPKFLIESQFNALVEDPHLTHQELTLLYMLWDTGARIGEIAQISQEEVNFDIGIVNIPYEKSKGNYSHRNVPISNRCMGLLHEQFGYARKRGHHKSIFLGSDNLPMTTSGLQKVVAAIGMRSSPLRPVMRLSAHQFRHSFGIRMIEKGVPQVIVQKWLGHQSLQMTSHYISLEANSSRRIFDKYCQTA